MPLKVCRFVYELLKVTVDWLTFQDRPSLRSLSTSFWQTALTDRHCFLHSCSLSSMMWYHNLQVWDALHRLTASSSPKICTLISVGSFSAKFWGEVVLSGWRHRGGELSFTTTMIQQQPERRMKNERKRGEGRREEGRGDERGREGRKGERKLTWSWQLTQLNNSTHVHDARV